MFKNQMPTPEASIPEPGHLPLPHALRIVMDSFTSATERHIEVGDGLEVFIVRSMKPRASEETATTAQQPAMDISLEQFGAVDALGGEDAFTPGACMVIRRELKKD